MTMALIFSHSISAPSPPEGIELFSRYIYFLFFGSKGGKLDSITGKRRSLSGTDAKRHLEAVSDETVELGFYPWSCPGTIRWVWYRSSTLREKILQICVKHSLGLNITLNTFSLQLMTSTQSSRGWIRSVNTRMARTIIKLSKFHVIGSHHCHWNRCAWGRLPAEGCWWSRKQNWWRVATMSKPKQVVVLSKKNKK